MAPINALQAIAAFAALLVVEVVCATEIDGDWSGTLAQEAHRGVCRAVLSHGRPNVNRNLELGSRAAGHG